MESVYENIRIKRLTRNYSQEYMAFALDISQAAYSNLERGETEITLRRLYEIAEILEVSPFELMPGPRSGTGINQEFFLRTLNKLKKFWISGVRKRLAAMPAALRDSHSDI